MDLASRARPYRQSDRCEKKKKKASEISARNESSSSKTELRDAEEQLAARAEYLYREIVGTALVSGTKSG